MRGADDDNLSIDARAAGAHDAVDATTMHRVDARWDNAITNGENIKLQLRAL